MSSCSEVPFVMERKVSAMIKNSCPVLARYTLIAPVVEKCLTIINEGVSPYRIKKIISSYFSYF